MLLHDLPYDIRVQIYSHLFPRTRHLYFHATDRGLVHLPAHDSALPVAFLHTCRALHQEASEYLYNGYSFDVVGKKLDCVEQYERLHNTIEQYARGTVHVRAFSNGIDSSTGCISILVGDAKLRMLERRRRGRPTTIEQLANEGTSKENAQGHALRGERMFWIIAGALGAVLAALGWWVVGMTVA